MSIEQILLLAAFIILPLVQYLLGAARRRDPHKPERVEGRGASPRRPPAQKPQSPPQEQMPELTGPPPAQAGADTLSDATAVRERKRARDIAGPVARPATARPSPRRAAVVDLRNRREAQRAIVLMTILAPSRAANPHEWPQRGGSR
jgi:hypothetical protein